MPEAPEGFAPEGPNNAGCEAPSVFLNEGQLAEQLGVSIRSIQAWRLRGGGPRFLKLGRTVRYRPADIEAWLAVRIFEHTRSRVSETHALSVDAAPEPLPAPSIAAEASPRIARPATRASRVRAGGR